MSRVPIKNRNERAVTIAARCKYAGDVGWTLTSLPRAGVILTSRRERVNNPSYLFARVGFSKIETLFRLCMAQPIIVKMYTTRNAVERTKYPIDWCK